MPAAMGKAICKMFLTIELSVKSFMCSLPSRSRQRLGLPRKRFDSRPIALRQQSLRDHPASCNARDICQRQIISGICLADAAGAELHVGKRKTEGAQDAHAA